MVATAAVSYDLGYGWVSLYRGNEEQSVTLMVPYGLCVGSATHETEF